MLTSLRKPLSPKKQSVNVEEIAAAKMALKMSQLEEQVNEVFQRVSETSEPKPKKKKKKTQK